MSLAIDNTANVDITIGREKTPYEKKVNGRYATPIALTIIAFYVLLTVAQVDFKNWILSVIEYWGIDQKEFIDTLHGEMGFVGTAVWTLTTIVSAFVAFYYSALGYRNYGMTNRNIISCTYGTCFIPALVALNALVVLFMTITYYVKWYTRVYLMAGYSFFLQALLICFCVFATTQYNAFKTILRIEVLQFNALYGMCPSSDGKRRISRNEKNIYYMQYILGSEEVLTENCGIINDILVIPYEKHYSFISKDFTVLFERQYRNFALIADYVSGNPGDASEMYEILYSVMGRICHAVERSAEKEVAQNNLSFYISFSALCHAFLPEKKLHNKWAFFIFLLNRIVKDEKKRRVLVIQMLASVQFLARAEKFDLKDEEEMRGMEKCFRQIKLQDELVC